MIPPHLFYQIYLSFLEQYDCTPPKCGELSEYTDSAHTEVENLSSRYMSGSNVYDRCGHDTRQLYTDITHTGFSTCSNVPRISLTRSPRNRLLLWRLTNLRMSCDHKSMLGLPSTIHSTKYLPTPPANTMPCEFIPEATK